MPVISDLLALLRRPLRADPPPDVPLDREPLASGAAPVTQAELLEALAALAAERQTAEEVLAAAAGQRDALLLELDDDALEAAGRQADRALLMLERLERVEPELQMRLAALRDQASVERWGTLRNNYVAAGQAHVAALRGIHLDDRAYNQAFHAIRTEFPDASRLLPLFYFPPRGVADDLEANLTRFGRIGFDPHPAPTPPRLYSEAAMIAHGHAAQAAAAFGTPLTPAESQVRRIRLKVARQIEGQWREAGAELPVPQHVADAETASGRAVLLDDGMGDG